jgi:hypothetical protein
MSAKLYASRGLVHFMDVRPHGIMHFHKTFHQNNPIPTFPCGEEGFGTALSAKPRLTTKTGLGSVDSSTTNS